MAQGYNKAMLVGNLGADPELKYTQSGQAVLRMRLATSESYADKAGQRQERVEWHTIVVWGKRGEALNKLLAKGSQIWIEGRIQTRTWEDKDGRKHYATEINALDVGLLGPSRNSREQGSQTPEYGEPEHEPTSGQRSLYDRGREATNRVLGDDDIPF
jgi:single-strand DNA-binding protein